MNIGGLLVQSCGSNPGRRAVVEVELCTPPMEVDLPVGSLSHILAIRRRNAALVGGHKGGWIAHAFRLGGHSRSEASIGGLDQLQI